MFLPIALMPDPVKYTLEVNKPTSGMNPMTQDWLHSGRLSYDAWLKDKSIVPGPDPFSLDQDPNDPKPKPYKPSASGLTPAKVKEVEYINADLARHYGMSVPTAYQEALLNTAYQREVADMKAAGLNPAVMYSGGRASGADTSLYPSEKRSGGGGSRRRYSGSKASDGKLFSTSAYAAIQAIGGLIGLGVSKNPNGFWVGSQTAKGAMGLLDALWKK